MFHYKTADSQQQSNVLHQPYSNNILNDKPQVPVSGLTGGAVGGSWVDILALFGSTSALLFTVGSILTSSHAAIASS